MLFAYYKNSLILLKIYSKKTDPHTEHHRELMQRTEDTNKCQDVLWLWMRNFNTIKMSIKPTEIYGFCHSKNCHVTFCIHKKLYISYGSTKCSE